jgi:molybdate transport system ATP-binding protein
MLDAHVVVVRPSMTVDVTLQAESGVVALVGPNGAGKSTVVRSLAGLQWHSGTTVVGGRTYDDAERGVHVPPHERSVSVVLQDALLFPHLSVVENVAFGPRSRGRGHSEALQRASDWLSRLSVGHLADRRPGTLSGGQAQRVALARGLVADPDLLLLDEPFSALDITTRWEVRRDVRQHLADRRGVTVLVTHDPVDALTLAERVAVVEDGVVVQEDTPERLARLPRTPYVARLVGLNLLRGRSDGTTVLIDGGARVQTATDATGPVAVTFSPSAVSLFLTQPDGSPRNVWSATVSSLDMLGETVRVGLAGPVPLTAEVTAAAVASMHLRPGDTVWASVKATEVTVSGY